jgi:TRAP-type uncharacterized transport system fused permease subunit
MGKVLVPFVFVFSPSLLIVVADFTWSAFALALYGCVAGIVALSAAFAGWLLGPVYRLERPVLGVAAILLVAPELTTTLIGTALLVAVAVRQIVAPIAVAAPATAEPEPDRP